MKNENRISFYTSISDLDLHGLFAVQTDATDRRSTYNIRYNQNNRHDNNQRAKYAVIYYSGDANQYGYCRFDQVC